MVTKKQIPSSDATGPVMSLFPGNCPSLETVVRQIDGDWSLAATRRRDLASALRRVAFAVGSPLGEIPADPVVLQRILAKRAPAEIGISRKTWSNIVSTALAALDHVGAVSRRVHRLQLNEDWQTLYDRLSTLRDRIALGRFMRFCANRGVCPCDISDQTVGDFRTALEQASIRKRPDTVIQSLTKTWNKVALRNVEGWPKIMLTVPRRRVALALSVSELPASFVEDLKRYISQLREPDPLAESGRSRPAAQATVAHRETLIRRVAGDVVRSGVPSDQLKSLSDLVQPDHVRRALRAVIARRDGKVTSTVHVLAIILKGIAKDYVRLPPEKLAELDAMCRKLRPVRRGMTERNRTRLRQLDDPANLRALLDLPSRLLRLAHSLPPKPAARLVEIALAVEIELAAPIRVKNLAGLHLGKHFQWHRAVKNGGCHLVIPESEVKNGTLLEFELNAEVLKTLNLYLNRHRRHAAPPGCPWLFPRRDGRGPVRATDFGMRIKKAILQIVGLEINVHLFRSIAAKLYLDRHPGGYEVVRQLLGHKALATTVAAYTGLEGPAAARHFDQTIRGIRRKTKAA